MLPKEPQVEQSCQETQDAREKGGAPEGPGVGLQVRIN